MTNVLTARLVETALRNAMKVNPGATLLAIQRALADLCESEGWAAVPGAHEAVSLATDGLSALEIALEGGSACPAVSPRAATEAA